MAANVSAQMGAVIERIQGWVRGVMWLLLLVALGAGCASKPPHAMHSEPAAYQSVKGLYGGGSGHYEHSYAEADFEGESISGDLVEPTSTGSTTTTVSREEAVSNQRASADRTKPNPERKLIRNAWMTLEVDDTDDFPATVETIGEMAEAMGGYMQSESSTSATILVPTDRIDEALEKVEKLGKVTYKNVTVVDATANYVDMQIRIENLRKMRVRLTELVNQSTSVKDVLEVERELARVTSELERIEGQMRLLGQQTSFATINVTLEERVKPGPLGWIFYGLGKGVKWLFIRN